MYNGNKEETFLSGFSPHALPVVFLIFFFGGLEYKHIV